MFNLSSFQPLNEAHFAFVEMKRKRINSRKRSIPQNKLSFYCETNGNFTCLILAEQAIKGSAHTKFYVGVSKRNPILDEYNPQRGFEVALSKACDSLFGVDNAPPSSQTNRKRGFAKDKQI